ncbi:hypothetical protein KSP35_22100 [Aquihabitans sp. G128]|uniref:RNA polymerase sigma factor n=1 Tax=Aquihabitans sp. G128 TaxID=2849779 RepID=UPI001C236050|nr:sigma factor [Aquihabitans sp. G128]QXC60972.1 hypothetical protein KSP35_22100 [Aquihabitans sp. G128]
MDQVQQHFSEAFPRLRPQLVQRLRRRHGRDEAEDLCDEAFARAWAGRASYRPDRGPIDAWINGIASKVSAEHLRRRAVAARHPPAARRSHDEGIEDRVVEGVIASQALAVVAAALTDTSPSDVDLLAAATVAAVGAVAVAPRAALDHVRLHRVRRRLAATVGRS